MSHYWKRCPHCGNIVEEGRVLVGEKGPEILDLPRGARVTPLDKDNAMKELDYDALRGVITDAIRTMMPELRTVVQVVPDNRGIFKLVQSEARIYSESTGEGAFA